MIMADQMVSNGKTVQDSPVNSAPSSGLTRERSFVRPNNHHQTKRRSLALNHHQQHIQLQQDIQMRTKPAMEIYRPPSKLCYTLYDTKLKLIEFFVFLI